MKNNDQKTKTFADGCNNHFFIELSDYEASINSGGFDVTNDLSGNVNFYTWDETSQPKKRMIAPGASQSYNENYILYDSKIGTGFNPVLSGPLGNGEYSFNRDGNQLTLLGAGGNYY